MWKPFLSGETDKHCQNCKSSERSFIKRVLGSFGSEGQALMEAGSEKDCLSALSEACPTGEKDSEFMAGRVGILSPEKGEVLKACCVCGAELNTSHTWNTRGYFGKAGGRGVRGFKSWRRF